MAQDLGTQSPAPFGPLAGPGPCRHVMHECFHLLAFDLECTFETVYHMPVKGLGYTRILLVPQTPKTFSTRSWRARPRPVFSKNPGLPILGSCLCGRCRFRKGILSFVFFAGSSTRLTQDFQRTGHVDFFFFLMFRAEHGPVLGPDPLLQDCESTPF